jgi:hypothetical protein
MNFYITYLFALVLIVIHPHLIPSILRTRYLLVVRCPFLLKQFSGAFAKLRKATISCIMSVRLSVYQCGITWLPPDGFSWNLICQYFSKVYRENSSFVKIWPQWPVLYMKTNIYFWSYLTHFFLEWKMFRTKVVNKIKTHIFMFSNIFRKSCRLWEKAEKYFRPGQHTDDNMAHAHSMLENYGY